MGHHLHTRRLSPRQVTRRLALALSVGLGVTLLEAGGGLASHSLALLADAGHMLFDLVGLGIAWLGVTCGAWPEDARRTFGYRRLEVLGALFNSILVIAMALGIAYQALGRARAPEPVEVTTMLSVATVGLVANLGTMGILHGGAGEIGLRGAFLHVLGDTLSSVGVLVGGGLIAWTGALWIDPALSGLIAIILAVGAGRLLRESATILLESVPPELDVEKVRASLLAVAGVDGVHALRLWGLTSRLPALSAHLALNAEACGPDASAAVRREAATLLASAYAIHEVTLQTESPGEACRTA